MNAIQPTAVSAARSFARRIAQSRHVAFWLHEVDPTWSLDTLRARVVDIVAETHDVRTFVLAPNRLWQGHLAGQFVTVEVEVDGVRVQRCYSIASAPGADEISITVKRVPGGRVSTWMHDNVRRGDVVTLGAPAGQFVVPSPTGKLLLVSGGSGATPVMSILRDLAQHDAVRDVVYVHAARSKRDVLFERELEALARRHVGLRLAFVLETDDSPRGGRLTATTLDAAVPDFRDRDTMLCGPTAMMDAISPIWTAAGIEHRLRMERFAPQARVATAPAADAAVVTMNLVRSGRRLATTTGDTILERLEQAGERPANGCRMGICNSCVCRKRSGVVEDVVTGAISSDPEEDIRLCVSRARSDIELAPVRTRSQVMSTHAVSRTLNVEESDAFGREMEALRVEVQRDLGERDVAHMRAVIRFTRRAEAGGRALLHFGFGPLSFVAGVAALSVSKILENMEIGHNVMHGQYDWTRDPELVARDYDWDNVCAASDWRHSHNFEHHTFTNILGKDRDVGYTLLRVTSEQRWHFTHLVQPISAATLALLFQWGVAMHDLRIDETIKGTQSVRALLDRARPFARKAAKQLAKDYLLFPALALWNAPRVAAGNLVANGARNLWTFAIIFCGHFPEGVRVYTESETRDESRGAWYVRQLNGSANIEGGKTFHVMTGHLSHQIEHHLFPDIPASRYPEMAPRVRAICERYGQAYNSGSFGKQMGSVVRQLFANAIPGRRARAALA